jgi:site-specific DNA-methyltransferase (adenine-specific)
MKTKTASFGTHKREGHDATAFYSRNLYRSDLKSLFRRLIESTMPCPRMPHSISGTWTNKIYCHTSEAMIHVPDNSVALGFTSPPYNSGKDFDADLGLEDYFGLIARVGSEVYRVLKPGGRYVINVANLGRKPLIPMHALYYLVHINLGFLPAGEIIWQKAHGASGNCAWGSWTSARSPRLRDIHEYLIVLVKDDFSRPDAGESTISGEEFMSSTLSIWDVPPESAKRVGHPAPFPVELAKRVIKLYSYRNDVVIDPFVGSGTTCVAAKALGRQYVGYDIVQDYCKIAERRLREEA